MASVGKVIVLDNYFYSEVISHSFLVTECIYKYGEAFFYRTLPDSTKSPNFHKVFYCVLSRLIVVYALFFFFSHLGM